MGHNDLNYRPPLMVFGTRVYLLVAPHESIAIRYVALRASPLGLSAKLCIGICGGIGRAKVANGP